MEIHEFVPLAPRTTFHAGGNARYFCTISTVKDLEEAIVFSNEHHLKVFVLGAGSNVLIADSGFSGIVIHMSIQEIQWKSENDNGIVTAGAGCSWDELVDMSVARGYWGMENLSGIPGSVGGSVVQNIGAYGKEVSSIVREVMVFDTSRYIVRSLSRSDCRFGYRDSIFKHEEGKNLIVISVSYNLSLTGKPDLSYTDLSNYFSATNNEYPNLREVREAVLYIRGGKFPDLTQHGTAGSYFKNPIVRKKQAENFLKRFPEAPRYVVDEDMVKLSAGWIIDHALGMKGSRKGQVGTWENQALVMVNYGGANASEIEEMAQEIQFRAKKELGIILEPEVITIRSDK